MGADRVKVAAPKDVGDTSQAYVAGHAAAHAGQHPHKHTGHGGKAGEQGLVGTAVGEQGHRDDVKDHHGFVELVEKPREEEGDQARDETADDDAGMVEHVDAVGGKDHVADKAAAQRGYEGENANSHDVEALVAGGEGAGDRAGDHGDELKEARHPDRGGRGVHLSDNLAEHGGGLACVREGLGGEQ